MLTRREVLIGGAAAGAAAFLRGGSNLQAAAAQPKTPVSFAVPAGACDTHVHVFGDPAKYPFVATRTYTPELASIAELQSLHRALHVSRVVVVHPSVYGTDNRCTVDAVKQLGAGARGIVVIDEKTPESALDEMARAGIRGIRTNLEIAGVTDPALARQRFQAALERVKTRNWHVVVNARLSVIEAIHDQVMAASVPVVFDHIGTAQGAGGVAQPGFGSLVGLVKSGKAYVKLSAAYRNSSQPDYSDMAPLAKALIAANLQRVLWGTDWPHPDPVQVPGRKNTDLAPLIQVDDGRMINLLAVWAPDAAQRQAILVDNPARLYGF